MAQRFFTYEIVINTAQAKALNLHFTKHAHGVDPYETDANEFASGMRVYVTIYDKWVRGLDEHGFRTFVMPKEAHAAWKKLVGWHASDVPLNENHPIFGWKTADFWDIHLLPVLEDSGLVRLLDADGVCWGKLPHGPDLLSRVIKLWKGKYHGKYTFHESLISHLKAVSKLPTAEAADPAKVDWAQIFQDAMTLS